MASAKRVVVALLTLAKTRYSVLLADRMHARAPPSENLVGVALVRYIPNYLVNGSVENVVEGHGQLHYSKGGTQMATGL